MNRIKLDAESASNRRIESLSPPQIFRTVVHLAIEQEQIASLA